MSNSTRVVGDEHVHTQGRFRFREPPVPFSPFLPFIAFGALRFMAFMAFIAFMAAGGMERGRGNKNKRAK